MNCCGVVGRDCGDCEEPCIFKFTDEEWEAYSRYSLLIVSALQEKQFIEEDINHYWELKRKLKEDNLVVEDVVNINLNSLRRQKKEVENRIKKLRKAELYCKNQLLERQRKN